MTGNNKSFTFQWNIKPHRKDYIFPILKRWGIRKVKDEKGFSIVEMLVVVFIFSIVIGIAMSVFVSALKIQRYNLANQQLLNQTSYSLEYMTRSIRMAQRDNVTCGLGGESYSVYDSNRGVRFITDKGACRSFYLNTSLGRLIIILPMRPLTSADFILSTLRFNTIGSSTADLIQPRVTMFMEIVGKGSGDQPRMKIQTTVSQRNLDMD